jgi:hypothetical protein
MYYLPLFLFGFIGFLVTAILWPKSKMKELQIPFAVFALAFFSFVLFLGSEEEQVIAEELKWFQGGTLHGSSVGEWNLATYRNKLATASDWTTRGIGKSEFERIGLSGVRSKSEELLKCIDGSTRGLNEVNSLSSSEIGAACIMLMRW